MNTQDKGMNTVTIELVQGDNALVRVSTQLTKDCPLDEVSGTLAHRIISLRRKAYKYKMNLGGFSFARKFDVKISMQGTTASGKNTIGLGSVEFGITIQNNDKSESNFHSFITELVEDILTGESQIEGTFSELHNCITMVPEGLKFKNRCMHF